MVIVGMKKRKIANLRLYLVDVVAVVDYVVVVVVVLQERRKKKRSLKLVEKNEGIHSRGYYVNDDVVEKDVIDLKDEHWEKDD